MVIGNTNVVTNLPGKTGAEVTNMREQQMSQIENNFKPHNNNKQENKRVLSNNALLTGIGQKLDIKI